MEKKNNYIKSKYKNYLYKGFIGKLFKKNHELMEKYEFSFADNILEIGLNRAIDLIATYLQKREKNEGDNSTSKNYKNKKFTSKSRKKK